MYSQYTISNINKKINLNDPKTAAMGFSSKGLKNEFETAVVNEPSVFEPLEIYCMQSVRHFLVLKDTKEFARLEYFLQ